jgi:hypothetical protein
MPILRCFALFAFGMVAIASCGSGGSATPIESWTYVGTWINQNTSEGGGPDKMVFTTDTLALYGLATDTEPDSSGPLTVTKDWTTDGYRYFQCDIQLFVDASSLKAFMLLRVGRGNQELGASESTSGYPTEIGTSSSRDNWIFTRQD